LNGTCAGGGYESRSPADEILMIDDRSSTVSLPDSARCWRAAGTGGLTRITDKRKVRRDLADFFCTTTEGVRADRAKDWGLVDHSAKRRRSPRRVRDHAGRLAAAERAAARSQGASLTPLKCTMTPAGYHYEYVDAMIDRAAPHRYHPPFRAEGGRTRGNRGHPRRRRRLVARLQMGARTR